MGNFDGRDYVTLLSLWENFLKKVAQNPRVQDTLKKALEY